MYAFFDHYTFSGTEDFVKYAKFVTNNNLSIAASFESNSMMDAVINTLSEHFKDKNILILSENEFTVDNDNPQCLTRILAPDSIMETIQGIGHYSPMHLLIITRNISSIFANLAVTSFAKQYHIPMINIMVDPLNHGNVVWY